MFYCSVTKYVNGFWDKWVNPKEVFYDRKCNKEAYNVETYTG